ncbi:Uncharacterised protein [Corynebacterium imitans]|uniref:Uncharacterized protein n=1 Tax=Corynebacterium imitans TaxID=156978 RepID=A0A076NQE8_9CORY|nr:hypothetical protein [Corynebacterium imitans]AIJ33940.1 hypothetical protein CIMIT_08480 [Corynebacterium imitans]SNV77411.1 Uncharacterised protein [Corynebacterium imitans]
MQTLKRVPKAAFIAGYGALLIALVVMVAALASYRQSADANAPAAPVKAWNPAPADAANVAASIRPGVIADARVATTATGVAVQGTLHDAAFTDPGAAGHISRLLEQNCLDTLTLRTTDNMRFELLGFCFSTVPPKTLDELIHFGADHGANSVTVTNNLEKSGGRLATLTWLDADAENLRPAWEEFGLRPYLDGATFEAYTPEELTIMEARPSRPHTFKHEPTGAALREKWGL